MPQEAMRAYGDNGTAEIAISGGNVTVSTQFHKVPIQDKNILFIWFRNSGRTFVHWR
ncbi:UNVERIFIED_ORG: hypothetical protein ABIC97_005544 [Peribacillus simplex]